MRLTALRCAGTGDDSRRLAVPRTMQCGSDFDKYSDQTWTNIAGVGVMLSWGNLMNSYLIICNGNMFRRTL